MAAKIDYSVFVKRAKKLARKLGKDEPEFVKQQTALLAREGAKYTPPFAGFPKPRSSSIGTKADQKIGMWAVWSDIKQIVSIKDDDVIEKAKKSWGNRPIEYGSGFIIAKGVIDSVGDLRAWHNSQQNGRGRTQPLMGPQRYWCSNSVFESYAKSEQENVGIAKAAFVKASKQLGGKGQVPAWVTKNLDKAFGSGVMMKDGRGTKGEVTSRAGGVFHTTRFLPDIMKDRLVKAVKRGEFLMKKAAKDSKFKVV